MFPIPQNLLTAGADNSPKFSANFSLLRGQEKLAELFGYYCYSNNSTQQQKRQGNKTSKDPSTVDILVLIPVAAQQVLECIFYTHVC